MENSIHKMATACEPAMVLLLLRGDFSNVVYRKCRYCMISSCFIFSQTRFNITICILSNPWTFRMRATVNMYFNRKLYTRLKKNTKL